MAWVTLAGIPFIWYSKISYQRYDMGKMNLNETDNFRFGIVNQPSYLHTKNTCKANECCCYFLFAFFLSMVPQTGKKTVFFSEKINGLQNQTNTKWSRSSLNIEYACMAKYIFLLSHAYWSFMWIYAFCFWFEFSFLLIFYLFSFHFWPLAKKKFTYLFFSFHFVLIFCFFLFFWFW